MPLDCSWLLKIVVLVIRQVQTAAGTANQLEWSMQVVRSGPDSEVENGLTLEKRMYRP